ncbi:acyltransferase family protein [Pseudomonadota bacterium]
MYRSDIDGLRAISVMAVIFFHSGVELLSGGYIGVDIFFVISGYLITGLIFEEIKSGNFTYSSFYKRRIARLLPSLLLTLLMVLIFGFIFYDTNAFDSLGKEIFFSAIGAANILFGQGVNYFAQEDSVRPLIHLWSLGVEEQFYLVWPTALLILALFRLRNILLVMGVLFLVSFFLAVVFVDVSPIKTYFYPQYRAFELMLGAFTALGMRSRNFGTLTLSKNKKELISYISLSLIVLPMFLLDKNSTFPGLNTLYPCVGTAMFIAFSDRTSLAKTLSFTPLVLIGLISYPLYLYHQPIVSYLQFFELGPNNLSMLIMVLMLSVPLSWLTYQYIERPIRRKAHKKEKSTNTHIASLVSMLGFFAIAGMFIAKNDGVGARFQLLNPFAYQVTENSATTFHSHFKRGLNVADTETGKILFIGDSLLQQYVYPLAKALNVDDMEIDTVTRGGCVLLKGVDFRDAFSDISCNDLRRGLYTIDKKYELIVVSQSWDSYQNKVLNMEGSGDSVDLNRWKPFIDDTVSYLRTMSNNIIIIGSHLKVEGTSKLSPTIFLSEDSYRSALAQLKVSNFDDLVKSRTFFDYWQSQEGVSVIHPLDIWSEDQITFMLHNEHWSFFSDSGHASKASTDYLVERLVNFDFYSGFELKSQNLVNHAGAPVIRPLPIGKKVLTNARRD